jgi:hypothetical protein
VSRRKRCLQAPGQSRDKNRPGGLAGRRPSSPSHSGGASTLMSRRAELPALPVRLLVATGLSAVAVLGLVVLAL